MNDLHKMLHDGNEQARPVIGVTVTLGTQTAVPAFVSPIDEKTAFELGGTMAEMDRMMVIDRAEINPSNLPKVDQVVEVEGTQMVVKAIKADQSAFVLGLAMVDAEADLSGED